MDLSNLFKLSSSENNGSLEPNEVVNAINQSILNYIKSSRRFPPTIINITINGTKGQCINISRPIFSWVTEAMNNVANKKYLKVRRPCVVAKISVTFCEKETTGKQKDKMTYSVECVGERPEEGSRVFDPSATRANEVDGSINVFDNVNELFGMGLNYNDDEINPVMKVLWQFNGMGKEDLKESFRITLTGGSGNACLNKTTLASNSYSILRFQNNILIKGAKNVEDTTNDPGVLYVINSRVEGDILKAMYDYNMGIWKYKLLRPVIIDNEEKFDSDTEYELGCTTNITVENFSLNLEPIGRPTKK